MNFLQLCQEVARDSGTVAGIPSFTTLASASGRIAQVAGWVRDAYIDIQNERNDWLWLQDIFDKPLIAHTAAYTKSALTLTRLGRFIQDTNFSRSMSLYDPAVGRSDEAEIVQINYPLWRQKYDIGVHDEGRPVEWAVSPAGELLVGPTPDKVYNIRGRYRKSAQVLAVDADVPEMPEEFHRVIQGEAIRLMAGSDEAFQSLNARAVEYLRLRNPLVIAQTPDVSLDYIPLA